MLPGNKARKALLLNYLLIKKSKDKRCFIRFRREVKI
jgi:hypothetical protein